MRIQASRADIKVPYNSSPEIVDWNEDGLLDLLVGSDPNGGTPEAIRLYLNSGTKTQYQFTTFSKVKANNADIALGRCQIQVLDLNSDGKKDLVAGHSGSTINFYENSGTNAAPVLKAAVTLKKVDNTAITAYGDIHLCFTDWNEDGVTDIVWTEYSPHDSVHLYLGQKQSAISHTPGSHQTFVHSNTVVTRGKHAVTMNLKNEQAVLLKLYNNSGRLVESKYTGQLKAGEHTVVLNLANNHAGIYLLRYSINNREMKQKIVFMR